MIRILASAVLALVLAAPAAQAGRAVRTFEVLAHVKPRGIYAADVFADHGYAYLSSYKDPTCPALGVRVYDLREPGRPRLVSTFARLRGSDTQKTIVRRVATDAFRGELAVTGVQRCGGDASAFQGFALYDVTNPRKPRRLALVGTEPRGVHELWLAAARGHAYVYAAVPRAEVTTKEPDLRIFDVTNPRAPHLAGEWGAIASLGLQARSGYFVHSVSTIDAKPLYPPAGTMRALGPLDLTESVHDPKLVGTTAFFSWYSLGVVAADVSDPEHPRLLARYAPPRSRDAAHAICGSPTCSAVWGVYPVGNGVVLASDLNSGLWVLRFR